MQILNIIINNIQQRNNKIISDFWQKRGNISIQILLNPLNRRGVDVVFDIINNPQFQEQRKKLTNPDNLDVIVDSFGGDADAAYHIAKLLDSQFKGTITYIIPRFAKSAATLLICGGNKIVMSETSELGPLDPQIAQEDGSFISAKAVQSALDLIKKQLKTGDKYSLELATILASRLNPLTLGQYERTIDIAKEYQKELLCLRMFSYKKDKKKVDTIIRKFATGYTHHSRVIGCQEAKDIFGDSLEILPVDSEEWKTIWEFYLNNRNIGDLIGALRLMDKIDRK